MIHPSTYAIFASVHVFRGLDFHDCSARNLLFWLCLVLVLSCGCRRCFTACLLRLPYQTLTELYNRTLTAVKDVPADAAYRVNIEKTTKHRLAILEKSNDIADVEAKFGIGQIEEVIEIAQDELDLIPHMAAWKPWEVAEGKPDVKIELID